MAGALDGLRVLDLSRILAGPLVGQMLGDLGAEVIKVERPGRGDDARAMGPPFLADGNGEEPLMAGFYLSCNRNKKSVAVDFAPCVRVRGAALGRGIAEVLCPPELICSFSQRPPPESCHLHRFTD